MRMIIAAVLMSANMAIAANSVQVQVRPAVVELFTSEGCSSCPPAEVYLGELAERPDVLALAFHVDYWDGLGLHDRFVIPEATPRQRGYARSLRRSSIYTPQIVVDGTVDFVGSDRARIVRALKDSRTGVPIEITVREGSLAIDLLSESMTAKASDVVLFAFARSAVSPIGRGENSGRTLTEYNIVRAVKHLGEYVGRAQTYRADLSSLPKDATDVAVIVQSLGQGLVLGAARYSLR
ncbi:MAG: DUF1223 domain-containing protein [Pseudomonadota bacterium]|nr:DUF1223 domain-containing protein [Pseudomonadota bacterium]